MLIENYDQGVIDVLDIYMKDCEEITLVEFGRGNGALAKKYLEEGKKLQLLRIGNNKFTKQIQSYTKTIKT